jgi:hypothetical protein
MAVVQWTAIYPDGPATEAAAGGGGGAADSGNPDYPGMPVGATPLERDVTITTATTTDLWTPGVGRTFVLASAFISTDTAMRIAIVDEADIQGQRPVDGYFAANGGASPNLVPVPYVSKNSGNRLRVVTAGAGNVKVRVSGWERNQ